MVEGKRVVILAGPNEARKTTNGYEPMTDKEREEALRYAEGADAPRSVRRGEQGKLPAKRERA